MSLFSLRFIFSIFVSQYCHQNAFIPCSQKSALSIVHGALKSV